MIRTSIPASGPGIEVVAFNPLRAHLNSRLNSRNHCKVVVIDGNIGYTGGVNLADEYANRLLRFGHWKDTAVKLKGDAVWSLSQMFLQLWAFDRSQRELRRPSTDHHGAHRWLRPTVQRQSVG